MYSDYKAYIDKKPSERYFENDGELIIKLLEKHLNVKFSLQPNSSKIINAKGLSLIQTGAFQRDGLTISKGYLGSDQFTLLQPEDYSLFEFPDGTIKGFELLKTYTNPYIGAYSNSSFPLLPIKDLNAVYKIEGTSGFDGLPKEIKNSLFSLFELLDRSYLNNKNTNGRGVLKSLSSDGKSISYDDGGLTNMLTIASGISPEKSDLISDTLSQYTLQVQPALI